MPLPSLNPQIKSFRPIGRKIVVVREAVKEEMKDGIIIPEKRHVVGLARGVIVSVSDTLAAEIPDLQPGWIARFPAQNGYQKFENDGAKHEIIPFDSIWSVEPPDAAAS